MNTEIEEIKTIYSSRGMTQKETEDLLRYAPHYKIDGDAFLRERTYSEEFLRQIWDGWDSSICKFCKLSLDFIREFHTNSCWNWNSVMNNIGIYTEIEMLQIQKEFHLVQKSIVQPWGSYWTTNFNWVEDI